MRGPPSPMVPRWSSPNAASINAANDSDGGTSPSPSLVSASYQELANRPRSNPRVRTPMRNISAVPLGTVNRSTIVDNGNDDDDAGASARVSNISSAAAGRSATGVRTQLGLGAGLAVGTVLREGDMALLHQQRINRERNKLAGNNGFNSDKQGPSHRKLRRWNNDKFVGIASEISNANPTARGTQIAKIFAEADMDRSKYTMPNSAMEHNSYFTTLLKSNGNVKRDGAGREFDAKHVDKVRERFLRGDVSNANENEMTEGARNRMRRREDDTFSDGARMVKVKVQERLLNVVRRACQSSEFSRDVLSAFEKQLVKHLSGNESSHERGCASEESESVLEEVLMQRPMVTRKSSSVLSPKLNSAGVKSVTIRFLFDNESNNGAFNRLLLHGVSQFHGLDTSSSTTSKGHRLLTVTGVCKGCQFQLLDFLDLGEGIDMNNDTSCSHEPVIIQSMSTLQVS